MLPRAIMVARLSKLNAKGENYVQLITTTNYGVSNKPRKRRFSVKLEVGEVCS